MKREPVKESKPLSLCPAGVAAVAIENTEGGKWIKENYTFSHCIPEELQSQIDGKYLDSFKSFKSWRKTEIVKELFNLLRYAVNWNAFIFLITNWFILNNRSFKTHWYDSFSIY